MGADASRADADRGGVPYMRIISGIQPFSNISFQVASWIFPLLPQVEWYLSRLYADL